MTLTLDVIMRWLTTDEMKRCDDLVFLNRHHYQSGEVPHKGHVVEVAASAQPSAVQRGRNSMPPADSTEACAAQVQIRAAVQTMLTAKRNVGTTWKLLRGVGAWLQLECGRLL